MKELYSFIADAMDPPSKEDQQSSIVDVINLFAASLEDSPSNRQQMMQISGGPSFNKVLWYSS